MTNELVKRFIGKKVALYSDNCNPTGTVVGVEENWVCLETKNGDEKLFNLDYIYRIDPIIEKNKDK